MIVKKETNAGILMKDLLLFDSDFNVFQIYDVIENIVFTPQ